MSRLTDDYGAILSRSFAPPGSHGARAHWAQVQRERKAVPDDLVLRKAYANVTRRLEKAGLPRMPKVRLFRHGKLTFYVLRIGDRMITSNSWRGLIQKAAWGPWQSFSKSTLIRKRWHENQA